MADLPIAVGSCPGEGGVHDGTVERRQREHGSPPDGGLVLEPREDGVQAGLVADRAQGGYGRLAAQRVTVARGDAAKGANGIAPSVGSPFAEGETGCLDDQWVGIVEHLVQAGDGERGADLTGPPAHRGCRIGEGGDDIGHVESAHPEEGSEGGRPNVAFGIVESLASGGLVAVVPGDSNQATPAHHIVGFVLHGGVSR